MTQRGFSIGDAVAEPFRLAFRKPLTTIAWGLVMILPSIIVLAGMAPLLGRMIAEGQMTDAADPAAGDFGSFQEMMMFQAWSGLSNILGLLALLLVTTAIIRAVLADRRSDGAAFLRIGKDEFQVAVIGVAIAVGVGALALVVGGVILGFGIAAGTGGQDMVWAGWTAGVLGVVLCLALLLLWGRLALLAPATVIRGDLAFEQGWRAGRGQTGRLFLLMLALLAVSILFGLVIVLLFMVAAAAIGVGFAGDFAAWGDEAAVEAWMTSQLENPAPLIGIGLVLLIPLAWIQGFAQTLWTAPYALAARSLVTLVGADAADAAG